MKEKKDFRMEAKNICCILKKISEISKKYLLFCVGIAILNGIMPFTVLLPTSYLIEELTGQQRNSMIVWIVLICILFPASIKLINAILENKRAVESRDIAAHLNLLVSDKLQKMNYEQLESSELLNKVQKLKDGSYQMGSVVAVVEEHVFGILSDLILLVTQGSFIIRLLLSDRKISNIGKIPAYIVFVARNSPIYFVSAIAIGIMVVLIRKKFQYKKQEIISKFSSVEREYAYYARLRADYENGADIRVNHLYQILKDKINLYNEKEKKYFFSICKSDNENGLYIEFLLWIQTISLYLLITCKLICKSISIGEFYLYSGTIAQVMISVTRLLEHINEFRYGMKYYGAYVDIWNIADPGSDSEGKIKINKGEKLLFCFEHVSFCYPGSDKYILKDVSFSFTSGEHIVLVGKNGAGKSTLVKLLLRLYKASQGKITLNGKNIYDYELQNYLSIFGVVMQDYLLLSASIKDNICSGDTLEDKRVTEVLKNVGLWERLQKDKQGDTILHKNLSEEGTHLSGGEEQKLVIARALYKNPEVVILDEPTASLDPYAEEQIYLLLDELLKSKVTFMISHRLSTCKYADKVFVLDQANMTAQGTHEDLLEISDLYQSMWNAQASHYISS